MDDRSVRLTVRWPVPVPPSTEVLFGLAAKGGTQEVGIATFQIYRAGYLPVS